MRKIAFVILIFCPFFLNAQEDISSIKIADKYASLIEFYDKQKYDFQLIIEKYYSELYNKNIDKQDFNKINKLRDLEVFKLLNKEQFAQYKKAKTKIESSLIYRF